jgi:GNAT superfamily N-acetyltransferase
MTRAARAGCGNSSCSAFGSTAVSSPDAYYRHGHSAAGAERYRCRGCGSTFSAAALTFTPLLRLLAVGGIKVPASKGRQRKFELSGASVPFQDYPVELGWVFVDEAHRQRKLSGRVVDALLPHFRGQNCYARSKESRHAMHATLNKRGFKRVGEPYASDLADENILLFIRPAAP